MGVVMSFRSDFVLPPGSLPTSSEDCITAWKIADHPKPDYNTGDFVQFWDNRHFENVWLHTPDDLINKVGVIELEHADGSYTVRLLGETDNYRIYAGVRPRVHTFPETFKHIYRQLINVEDVTSTTHAFGAFMQGVESLVQ